MRNRLIELQCLAYDTFDGGKTSFEHTADVLLENGVIVLSCKPIGVMTDGNEFNSDVYCPYCGTNLSGLYGDEPTRIIQCYQCGKYLDNTKTITKEEAEQALKGGASDGL